MRLLQFASLSLAILLFAACDDNTDTIGSTLSNVKDFVEVSSATFDVSSQSLLADSVLSNSTTGYLGKVKDPETGAYITGDFMAQFNCLEDYTFPKKEDMVGTGADGKGVYGLIRADSCKIRLFFSNYYGDSTRTMKIKAMEMGKTMNEDRNYYSNFDPLKEGYIRTNGLTKEKVFSLVDYNVPKHTRDTATYTPYITIKLNQPYTDSNGKTYNNYGTYILQTYYEHPEYFKNSYTFRNHVVPGFFFKTIGGLGSMAYISDSQLDIFFNARDKVAYTDTINGEVQTLYKDSIYNGATVFWGTEEVLQTTTITNDHNTLAKLAADESCTYLKTPSGIFTEMTLPIDDIIKGHENDTITSAKIVVSRLNNETKSDYAFDVPKTVLMIPRDSLYSFFEHHNIYNNKTSFSASWTNSSDNSYVFNNIAGMITAMKNVKTRSENWNKVVLVPVEVTTTTTSSSYSSSATSTKVTKVVNDMSLSSTRLVKGTSSNSPIKISVIYSKFQ